MKHTTMMPRPGHHTWSRRRFMEILGTATLGGGLLAACGEGDDSRPADPGTGEMMPDPIGPILGPPDLDPTGRWWLDGMYRPVEDERDDLDLIVEGELPAALDGMYVRNGPNPTDRQSGHWFGGDGMVHGVRLEGGKASWYRNRYIRTAMLEASEEPEGIPPKDHHPANISLMHHGDRLLALGETGFPFELDPERLETRHAFDYEGQLTTAMTAHPKVDPITGRMYMFGYGFLPPYLTYYEADADGTITHKAVIDVPAPSMMHDIAFTATRVVFLDLPVIFDLNLAIEGDAFPFRWRPETHGARLGVMPHGGTNDDVVWIEIEPGYIFHTVNAYDDEDGRVVLEAVRHEDLFVDGVHDIGSSPRMWRYVLDATDASVEEGPIETEQGIEFPMMDRRFAGRRHSMCWALGSVRATGQQAIDTVFAYDRDGIVSQYTFPAEEQPDEAFFVPASPGADEGKGWLVGFAHTRDGRSSSLYVIDTQRLEDGPIARVRMPRRVPAGIHGLWVPA